MKTSQTAVLEQGNIRNGDFVTEPFEAGWASEARWFVRILDPMPEGSITLNLASEISPDGILWCADEDSRKVAIQLPVDPNRVFTLKQREFGNWLRLQVTFGGNAKPVKFLIYLVLKE